MTIKELKEKLDSLYDPKMMTFNVERSKDKQNTVIISNFSPLTGRSYVMYEIGPKKNDIEITIAYIEGQILGCKKLKNKPGNHIKALKAIKDFAEEKLKEVACCRLL